MWLWLFMDPKVPAGTGFSSQMSSSSGAVGKSSSSSAVASWKGSSEHGVAVSWVSMWCWRHGEDSTPPCSGVSSGILWCHNLGSCVLTGLSSLELVNTKWWHAGLWLLNLLERCSRCCSAVVSGVVGSKDIFSLVEMWYIHGAFLRGMGILKILFPLSYPSSCASSCLKASFKVVTKWPNNISSDMFLKCCANYGRKSCVDYFNDIAEDV